MSLRAYLCIIAPAPFKEMRQKWQAIGNTVLDRSVQVLNLRPPAPDTNALLLGQNKKFQYVRIYVVSQP